MCHYGNEYKGHVELALDGGVATSLASIFRKKRANHAVTRKLGDRETLCDSRMTSVNEREAMREMPGGFWRESGGE